MRHAERLRSGLDRDLPGEEHAACGLPGCVAEYRFAAPAKVEQVRLTLDSDLNRLTLPARETALNRPMWHNSLHGREPSHLPRTLLRDFDLVCIRPDGTRRVLEVRDKPAAAGPAAGWGMPDGGAADAAPDLGRGAVQGVCV